jgi:gamma-glutamylcyclotransferase (GGCT)/AIG2-like uncharacterized protein YtfP
MEKIFVYGRLKDTESMTWYLPNANTVPYILHGFKMYIANSRGSAGVVVGSPSDYVEGEIKTLRFPWIQKIILDIREGVFLGVYKRKKILLNDNEWVWIYLHNKPTTSTKVINVWISKHKN